MDIGVSISVEEVRRTLSGFGVEEVTADKLKLLTMIVLYIKRRRAEGATDFVIQSEVKASPIFGYTNGNLLDADIRAAFLQANGPTTPPAPTPWYKTTPVLVGGALLGAWALWAAFKD